MSEYTSTKSGFQKAMEWSLTGPPSQTKAYAEATVVPTFYHVMNGERLEYDAYVKGIEEWRGKISEYKPVVEEFLRDGQQIAARMTGTIKIEGVESFFESFMFGVVDGETGKLVSLVERSVWGRVGKEPEHGVH
ncbi:hypothetical protein HBH56_135580 [Parastagonospora nodorum]|uniref:SnoaL-like domain-containing protein n=1 Tax=Phaeosphaeria nodorum (strain SN15 / ATCC MYA-4574 / FGSC 10173) TaxID=321614 RepID=A0A7U2I784_PHANO|nr:hypothetical protein HBH56_135580 [Parastagonospora nodorum]QRD02572.1 hypothetical protein JI435_113290 [Parastagonospora nodorum SN15]KAH3927001.1 hypothetical protein HBH54_157710 [Parastagonospora nodorum]KAH3949180.1 hypothetical protein HBH53_090680 [Parastagonospora nodorum]KAH3991407.1 hypothetical protein HBI10_233400 [Parastagonospora nodorum]